MFIPQEKIAVQEKKDKQELILEIEHVGQIMENLFERIQTYQALLLDLIEEAKK